MPAKGQDMQASRVIAKLLGPLFLAIGVGMLINAGTYRTIATEALKSFTLIYFSGLVTLLGGLAIVIAHNIWAKDWRVIITVFGWLAVLGGIIRIVVPQVAAQIGTAMFALPGFFPAVGIVVLALGAFLGFKGTRP